LFRESTELDQDGIFETPLWTDGCRSGVTGDTRFDPDSVETCAGQVGWARSHSR
jgi:hypothetical protein